MRGDYPRAVASYRTLADAGNSTAMVRLAALCLKGEGVTRDVQRAVRLYMRAAQHGNADAQYSLGNLYLLGEGVPQDDDWAFTYYRRAAEQGHALAQKNVREFYRSAGIEPPAALTAAPAASSLPNPPAPAPPAIAAPAEARPEEFTADELKAIEIARASGIRVDLGEAAAGFPSQSAGEPAAPPTLRNVKRALAAGRAEQALPDLEVLASSGNAEAQFLLSEVIATLQRSPEDADKALIWLQRAAESGYAEAQFKLAGRYLRGDGLPVDEAEAVTWYRAAARQGHAGARDQLEAIYREVGIPFPDAGPPAPPPARHDNQQNLCSDRECLSPVG